MRIFRSIVGAAALVGLLAAPAHAGLIFNQDSRAHEIVFERGAGRANVEIEPNRPMRFVCDELPCRITLKATGQTVSLERNDQDVIIENGRLRRR